MTADLKVGPNDWNKEIMYTSALMFSTHLSSRVQLISTNNISRKISHIQHIMGLRRDDFEEGLEGVAA